jgi:hypothetical protein
MIALMPSTTLPLDAFLAQLNVNVDALRARMRAGATRTIDRIPLENLRDPLELARSCWAQAIAIA